MRRLVCIRLTIGYRLGIVLFSEQKRRTHVFAMSRRLVWPFPRIPSGHNPLSPAFPWGGAPRSELKSNNCQWQLLHNVKVARASPASARRMRAACLSLWERCPAGAERACLPSQSLRDSSPRVGAKGVSKSPPGLNIQAGRRLRYSLFISLDRVLK